MLAFIEARPQLRPLRTLSESSRLDGIKTYDYVPGCIS
jgi:hypothetical protein